MVEIKLWAMKRIGELSLDLPKAQHGSVPGRRSRKVVPANGGKNKEQAIRNAGLSPRTAARYEGVAGPLRREVISKSL